MTKAKVPNCIFCEGEQSFDTIAIAGIFASALVCENGGCAASGPNREAETTERAEKLALDAYNRAAETVEKLKNLLERTRALFIEPADPTSDEPERLHADICAALEDLDLGKSRRFKVGFNRAASSGGRPKTPKRGGKW